MIGLLYWLVYGAAWLQLRRVGERTNRRVRLRWWGAALWLAVGVPSCLQLVWPAMLSRGAREPVAIAQGEWWRLFTSMFLQDGGWPGTVFNLVTLAVTVLLVGAFARGWVLPVLFVLGGVVCNALTVVVFAEPGAGNSMATMVLVVVVAVWSVSRAPADLILTTLLVAAAATLLLVQDQHGLAVSLGLVLGVVSRRLGEVGGSGNTRLALASRRPRR